MPIKTKSIFEPAEPEDGHRILITRFYPRGVKKEHFDQWAYVLSPSPALLASYKKGEKDWGEFKESFLAEMRISLDSLEAIQALNSLSQVQDITLLCYERSGVPCHRHLVREIIAAPFLLSVGLEPEDTDDHERARISGHVSDKKADIVSVLA